MDKKKHFNFSKKQKITIFSLLAILILIASVVGFFVFRFYNHSYEGNTDPAKVAEKILADIDEKRAALGWAEVK